MTVTSLDETRQQALELARANPKMTWAAIARAVDQPYTRVYGWVSKAGLVREAAAAYIAERAEQAAATDRDRERLGQLLSRYEAGELVPQILPEEVAVIVHDILSLQRSVARLGAETRCSMPGEPLTDAEQAALEDLDTCVLLRARGCWHE